VNRRIPEDWSFFHKRNSTYDVDVKRKYLRKRKAWPGWTLALPTELYAYPVAYEVHLVRKVWLGWTLALPTELYAYPVAHEVHLVRKVWLGWTLALRRFCIK